MGRTVNTTEDAGKVSQEFLRRGCGSVIVTLGSQGCVVLSSQDSQPKHIATTPVTAVDTTVGNHFYSPQRPYIIYKWAIPCKRSCP